MMVDKFDVRLNVDDQEFIDYIEYMKKKVMAAFGVPYETPAEQLGVKRLTERGVDN